MKSTVIELARFRVKEGITDDAFQSLIRETYPFRGRDGSLRTSTLLNP